jgi:uronate dehydrogenase
VPCVQTSRGGESQGSAVRRVLITGAAGTIGTILREGFRGRFDVVRLLDVGALGSAQPGEEIVTADVRNLNAVAEAMAGVSAVVHLAGIPHEDALERIMQTNMVGTYHVFEAARQQGCPRVVLASSAHVTGFYDAHERLRPNVPLRPDSFYAVGKAFAENLGRLYADKHGLEVVCLRLGTVADRPTTPRHLSTWLSPRDAVDLFSCSLTAPGVGFTVAYGASDNRRGWWDLGSARQLGYHPADDAERWATEIEATTADPSESGSGPQGGGYAFERAPVPDGQ